MLFMVSGFSRDGDWTPVFTRGDSGSVFLLWRQLGGRFEICPLFLVLSLVLPLEGEDK